ncbi:MAG: Gfo/Idh/MocA family oxidoreductase, partial [Pirellulaceae bacterium]
MSGINRRTFVAGAAGAIAASQVQTVKAAASETVTVAVLGCGRGSSLASWFSRLPDSQVAVICDVDQNRAGALCEKIGNLSGRRPESVTDFRRLLERKDIDALVVATPDHWHAPVTIHSC